MGQAADLRKVWAAAGPARIAVASTARLIILIQLFLILMGKRKKVGLPNMPLFILSQRTDPHDPSLWILGKLPY